MNVCVCLCVSATMRLNKWSDVFVRESVCPLVLSLFYSDLLLKFIWMEWGEQRPSWIIGESFHTFHLLFERLCQLLPVLKRDLPCFWLGTDSVTQPPISFHTGIPAPPPPHAVGGASWSRAAFQTHNV